MKNLVFTILACLLAAGVFAQWSTDPTAPNLIAGFPGEQVMPKTAVAENGNVYICRFDNNGGAYKVYLNLLSPQGVPLWADPNGLLISEHTQMSWLTEYDLTVDNDGNAVIVFQDIRNADVNNVMAYKVSPTQVFLWGVDGVAVSLDTSTDYSNMSPVVFNSSDNSTYVAWQRLGPNNTIAVINRLSATGQKLWGDNGIQITPPTGSTTWPQVIQSDGDNILLKYYQDTGPVWAPTRHLHVAKYNAGGIWLWDSVMTDAGGMTAWQQLIPFEPDGAGGAILAWYEDRDQNMDNDVYCQHVNVSGGITMPEDGALMSVDPSQQQYYPELAVDTANQNIYAFFRVTNANQDNWGLGRQMLDYSGNRLWGETAPLFVDISSFEANTIGAYYTTHGAICLFERGVDNLYATCYRSSGNLGWNNVTTIAESNPTKYHFDFASHPDQWCVLAWEQGGTEMDIYAMRLNGNGSLGMEYPSPRALTANFVPPDAVLLNWQASSAYIVPDSYYIYMNGTEAQVVAGDVLTYTVTNLSPGSYDFYLKARYGDVYSEPTETVTVTVTANDDAAIPPCELNLAIRPNPFSTSATLTFSLDKPAPDCHLTVFNLRGQKVAELLLPARKGMNEAVLEPQALGLRETGVFLLRLEAGGSSTQEKIVYMK